MTFTSPEVPCFDFSKFGFPKTYFSELDLLKPIYKETARNGHFGKSIFAWEKSKKLMIRPEFMDKLRSSELSNGDVKRNGFDVA